MKVERYEKGKKITKEEIKKKSIDISKIRK